MRQINIVNQSTVVAPQQFPVAVAACQVQLTQHFAPAWSGLTAILTQGAALPTAPEKPVSETIYILDNSDQMDALGYHEVAAGDIPCGFVFAKTSADDGVPWTTTLSHELLEQLVDPFVQSCIVCKFLGRQAAVALEVADPVEEDSYLIGNVPVSNFVLPAWFQDTAGAKGPFDYLDKLTAPLSMTPGGYVAYTLNLKTWRQDIAQELLDRKPRYHRRTRGHRAA